MNQRGFMPILIVLGFILIFGVVGTTYYLGRFNSKPQRSNVESVQPSYKVIYCFGHSGTVDNIKINNGKIIPPDRSGTLASSTYDYKCYLVNVDNTNKSEASIASLNNLPIEFTETSTDGYTIIREGRKSNPNIMTGLVVSDIYLSRNSEVKNKIAFERETAPTQVFKLIGWLKK